MSNNAYIEFDDCTTYYLVDKDHWHKSVMKSENPYTHNFSPEFLAAAKEICRKYEQLQEFLHKEYARRPAVTADEVNTQETTH